MIQEKSGFVYDFETKELIVSFEVGNDVYKCNACSIFYGNKEQAIEFGIIFNEQI
jgi:hypothetical protein